MEVKVGKTYKLIEKINSGAFGEVFRGVNEKTQMGKFKITQFYTIFWKIRHKYSKKIFF